MKLLLDSVILIDHFSGIAAATQYLSQCHAEAAISVVTRAEVLTGFDVAAASKAMPLLDSFPSLGIDAAVADLAATLRRNHGWKLPDAFQAAIAQHHGMSLATRNVRDFPANKFPFVIEPYRAQVRPVGSRPAAREASSPRDSAARIGSAGITRLTSLELGQLITRSMRSTMAEGRVMPIARATAMLATNSKWLGRSNGNSPGAATLRILST